jgi:hypothetical protein
MDLRDFITEALVQVQEGVQNAINRRTATPGASGVINPVWGGPNDISRNHIQNVEFDVAVTVTESSSRSGTAGLRVFSVVNADGEVGQGSEHSTVSRVRVTVPMVPPVQLVRSE